MSVQSGQKNMLNEFYAKCTKQQREIENLGSEILKGDHDKVLDKIRQKLEERLCNFDNSIGLLQKGIEESIIDMNLWKKKIENLRLSYITLKHQVEEYILKRIKKQDEKHKSSMYRTGFQDSSKIGQLTDEYNSLKQSLKRSQDIENQTFLINTDLEAQQGILDRVKSNAAKILGKSEFTNTITQWLIKRGKNDLIIFSMLAVFTLMIMYFTYYYVKPWIRGASNYN